MLPVLRPVAVGAVLLTLLAAVCLASGSHAEIKVATFPGFDNTYRPDSWTPLTVHLTGASTTNATGRLQLLVRTSDGTTSYAQPLQLRAGSLNERHVLHYFHPSGAMVELIVQVVVDGRILASKNVEGMLPLDDRQIAIVALTQDQSGLTYLNRLDLGFQHSSGTRRRDRFGGFSSRPYMGAPSPPLAGSNPMRVLYPRSSDLPDSSHGYSGIDVIVLGDLPLDLLTEARWEAIMEWVKDGGTLVISGGADINRFRSQPLADILPIIPSGVRQARSLPALGERYGASPRFVSTAVLDGVLRSDALAICQEGNRPLVSLRRLGRGRVFFMAFDTFAPEFRAWRGQSGLWGEMLALSTQEMRVGDIIKASNQVAVGAPRWLTDALAGIQSTQAPSFLFIGLFLLLYILCLVPLNYYLLKKRDRKEMAWITAPLIVLFFTTGAYAMGRAIKGGQLFLRYGAVIEGAANTDSWAAYTTALIFSPSQTRYDLSIADPAAMPTEVRQAASRFQRAAFDLIVERGQKTVVKDVLVNMWDHRLFDFESHVRLGGTVAASALPGSNGLEVKVTNNLPFTLEDCAVTYRGTSMPMGTLAPGQSQTVRLFIGGQHGYGGGVGIPTSVPASNNDAVARIRQALSWTASVNEGGAEGRNPLVFVGWFTEPVLGLNLENADPRIEGVNLLVAHLPTPGFSAAPVSPLGQPPNARLDPFAGARSGRTPQVIRPPVGSLPGGPPFPGGINVPPIPQTGSGSRRLVQPAPGGGHYVILQRWNHGPGGSSSQSSTTYVPPGQPIP